MALNLLKEVELLGGSNHGMIVAAVRLQLSDTYVRERALRENEKIRINEHNKDNKNSNSNGSSNAKGKKKKKKSKRNRRNGNLGNFSGVDVHTTTTVKDVEEENQWKRSCTHLIEGMRVLNIMLAEEEKNKKENNNNQNSDSGRESGGVSGEESSGGLSFVEERTKVMARRLIQCSIGWVQSILRGGVENDGVEKEAVLEEGVEKEKEKGSLKRGQAAMLAIETTLNECQSVLKFDSTNGNTSHHGDGEEEEEERAALNMDRLRILSMIGDVSIFLHDALQQQQQCMTSPIPSIVYQILTVQQSITTSLPEYGGDLHQPPHLPILTDLNSITAQNWLHIGTFSLISAVQHSKTISATMNDLDLLRRLASAKNRQGQNALTLKMYDNALDIFSASLNLFHTAGDNINVGWIKMNIITTMRRMAGGVNTTNTTEIGVASDGEEHAINSEQSSLYASALELVNGILNEFSSTKNKTENDSSLISAAQNVLANLSLSYGTRLRKTVFTTSSNVCNKQVANVIQRHLELAMRLSRTVLKDDNQILIQGHRQIAIFLEEQANRMEKLKGSSNGNKKTIELNRELAKRHYAKCKDMS